MADSNDLSTPEDIREAVESLEHRLDTIEDKVMMERLEDLALRDEIEAIEDILDQEGDDLRKKLKVLNRVAEEYEGQQFEKKLHFLYNKIQELEEQSSAKNVHAMQERLSTVEDRVESMADTVDQVSSPKDGRDLDDVYDKLHALRDRMQSMSADSGSGSGGIAQEQIESLIDERLEDVDRRHAEKVQEELDAMQESVSDRVDELADRLETVQETVAALDDEAPATEDELEDQVEQILTDLESSSVSAAEVNALEDTVADIEEELHAVSGTVETHTERLDDAADERASIVDEIDGLQETVDELSSQVATASGGDIPEQSLLEAIEYTAEQVQRKVEAIDTQIDALHETAQRQEERIDGVASAQNIFESEIGELMEQQKELNDEFQEADTAISRKLDMLLEAIEEGLAEEQAQIQEINRGVQDAIGDAPVDQEQVARQQQQMAHTEAEEPDHQAESAKMKKLAETALQNQKQIAELHQQINDLMDRIDELQSDFPTIVE